MVHESGCTPTNGMVYVYIYIYIYHVYIYIYTYCMYMYIYSMYSHRYHSLLVWLILGGSTEVALSPRPPGRRRCQRPASANPWRDPCVPCCLASDPTSSRSESLDGSIDCQSWIACMFLLAGYKIFLWQKIKELNYPSKVDLVLATTHMFFTIKSVVNSILIGKYSISLNMDQERFGGSPGFLQLEAASNMQPTWAIFVLQ